MYLFLAQRALYVPHSPTPSHFKRPIENIVANNFIIMSIISLFLEVDSIRAEMSSSEVRPGGIRFVDLDDGRRRASKHRLVSNMKGSP